MYQLTLAQWRSVRGYTQEGAAKKMNVCRTTLRNWEKGKSKPSPINLRAISWAYNVPISAIILH